MNEQSIKIFTLRALAFSLVFAFGCSCASEQNTIAPALTYVEEIKSLDKVSDSAAADAQICYRHIIESSSNNSLRQKILELLSETVSFREFLVIETTVTSHLNYDFAFLEIQDQHIYWMYVRKNKPDPAIELHKKKIEPEDDNLVSMIKNQAHVPDITPPPSKNGMATNRSCAFSTLQNKNGAYKFLDMQGVAMIEMYFPDKGNINKMLEGEKLMFEFYQFFERNGIKFR